MVVKERRQRSLKSICPHCGSGWTSWDNLEKEQFCCICGWRQSIPITQEQAKDHFKYEREFWLKLFASAKDPDEGNSGPS